LYPKDTQKLITTGVELMMRMALRLLGKQGRSKPLLLLEDASGDKEEDVNNRVQGCHVVAAARETEEVIAFCSANFQYKFL
jgi:hypothetical protein